MNEKLDSVLSDVKKISEAPSPPPFDSEEEKEKWFWKEEKEQYKAIDRVGNVYLVQNPCCWGSIKKDGVFYRVRPKPHKAYSAKDMAQVVGKANSGDVFMFP